LAERIAMGPFGSSIKVETFVNQGIPIISGQHLRNFILEDSTFNFITEEHGQKLAKAIVKRGDVIFTHAGNIGQVSLIPANSRYDQYVISQRQFFMRCDLSRVSPLFIAFYFSSPDGRHRLLANTSSSGVPSIARPVSYLRSIPLIVPQSALLATFDRLITPLVQQIRDNWNNIRTLNATRDALLPKLVSGELRVTGR
jgi:type I restriction enzyme S subunit